MMSGKRCVGKRDLLHMRQCYEHQHGRQEGWRRMARELKEELEKKTLRPRDFSIAELAESLVPDGREWINEFVHPKNDPELFFEASGDAVSTALFFNITGQLLITEVQERFMDEEFVFMKAIDHRPSKIVVGMERLPGFAQIGDEAQIVPEGKPYPMVGFSEDFIELGVKQKRGFLCPLSRECIAADLTGQLMDFAGESAHFLGLNTEKRIIDAIIDEGGGAVSAVAGGHRYHWKGTSYASFVNTPWDNTVASNALLDWSDIDNAWQTLAAIRNPYTNEPILIQPDTMIVAPGLQWRAAQLVAATQVRNTTPGFATTANPVQTDGPNPIQLVLGKSLTLMSSRLLSDRLATDTDWFLGNVRKAVRRYYNWDIETQQAPADSQEAFQRDIVTQFKVGVRDVVSVIQPRVICKSSA